MADDRILILTVGIPGCGKTTFCRNFFEPENIPVVSSDAIRGELYGDESIQGNFDTVFDEVYRRANEELDTCGVCVIDATNVGKWARKQAIRSTKPREVYYVIMNRDINRAKSNNRRRERFCPESVIDSMFFKLKNEFPKGNEARNLTIFRYDSLDLLDKIKEWSIIANEWNVD